MNRDLPWRPLLREVARLSLPITFGNLAHTMVSLSDTYMVGYVGEDALAAVGAASILWLVLFLVFSGLAQGVQVLCARRLGEGRAGEAGAILQNGLAAGLVVGLLISAAGLFLSDAAMGFFSHSPTTIEMGGDYLYWRWGGGMWLLVLIFVFKGFYWGIGLTRIDLLVSLIANLANIFLNWVFIFGNLGAPEMGAGGAGLASALANVIALAIYAGVAASKPLRAEYGTYPRGSVDRPTTEAVLRLSLPKSAQGMAFAASAVFFAIVGRFVGVISLFLFLFPGPALELFLHAREPAEAAAPTMRLLCVFQVIDAIGIILARALIGAGAVMYVMVMEIVCGWLICLPLALLGVHVMADSDPLLGAWWGWAGYMTGWCTLMWLRWRRRESWQRIRV